MVKIYYKNISKIKYDRSIIDDMKRCIKKTVVDEGKKGTFEVTVTICTNEYIHELNNEYRGVDSPTDVLSFPLDDFDIQGGLLELGDIIISIEKAMAQANEYGHSLRREMCFLCVHSTLHLLGYDHENENERKYMEDKQNAILDSLGITRDAK